MLWPVILSWSASFPSMRLNVIGHRETNLWYHKRTGNYPAYSKDGGFGKLSKIWIEREGLRYWIIEGRPVLLKEVPLYRDFWQFWKRCPWQRCLRLSIDALSKKWLFLKGYASRTSLAFSSTCSTWIDFRQTLSPSQGELRWLNAVRQGEQDSGRWKTIASLSKGP